MFHRLPREREPRISTTFATCLCWFPGVALEALCPPWQSCWLHNWDKSNHLGVVPYHHLLPLSPLPPFSPLSPSTILSELPTRLLFTTFPQPSLASRSLSYYLSPPFFRLVGALSSPIAAEELQEVGVFSPGLAKMAAAQRQRSNIIVYKRQ